MDMDIKPPAKKPQVPQQTSVEPNTVATPTKPQQPEPEHDVSVSADELEQTLTEKPKRSKKPLVVFLLILVFAAVGFIAYVFLGSNDTGEQASQDSANNELTENDEFNSESVSQLYTELTSAYADSIEYSALGGEGNGVYNEIIVHDQSNDILVSIEGESEDAMYIQFKSDVGSRPQENTVELLTTRKFEEIIPEGIYKTFLETYDTEFSIYENDTYTCSIDYSVSSLELFLYCVQNTKIAEKSAEILPFYFAYVEANPESRGGSAFVLGVEEPKEGDWPGTEVAEGAINDGQQGTYISFYRETDGNWIFGYKGTEPDCSNVNDDNLGRKAFAKQPCYENGSLTNFELYNQFQ